MTDRQKTWAKRVFLLLVVLVVANLLTMLWMEGSSSLLGQAEDWITTHDLTIDLVTVWALVIGFATLSIVDFATWASMLGQYDETQLGSRLRPKKLGNAIICLAMSMLYGMSLFAYYREHQFDIWTIFLLRIFLIVGIITASLFGARFFLAFRRETRLWDRRQVDQGHRESQQDSRDVTQQLREDEWDEEHPEIL
jgi:hypothetical protein